MSQFSLMVTITNKVNADRFQNLYNEMGATVSFLSYGRGTATSAVLNTFGLERAEKAILHTVIVEDLFPKIRKELEQRFVIDVPGTGIVFLIPLSAVGGKRQLELLTGNQDFVKGEETTLKNTEKELIVVISNQGYSEKIMDAARSARAGGGTVIHAKGTGKKSEKFFGFVLAEEKEMHYIVVASEIRDAVMRAIMDQAGLRTKAQAVCFSLPVTAVAGMRLISFQQEESTETPAEQ